MTLGKQADITLFLKQFKMIAQSRFQLIPRQKNMKDLARLGISRTDAKNTIFQLTYRNYVSGPSKDIGNKKYNVWVFGAVVGSSEIYIKLSDDFRGNAAKCISFHETDSKCSYPYKRNTK